MTLSPRFVQKHLPRLIAQARNYKMTAQESEAQIRSLAFGNTHYENSSITREDIDQAWTALMESRNDHQ